MTQYPTNAADECNDYYHRYVRRQKALQKELEGGLGTFLLWVIVVAIILLIIVKSQ